MASDPLKNDLLAKLDKQAFGAIEPHLKTVQLNLGYALAETQAHVQRVYFPHGGIISCVVELVGGGAIETGMIGKDGQFGGVPALEQFFLAQVQQTAACNAVHPIAARACRWLLRMQRLVGDDLNLTQEFLAQMMGVQRSGVNAIAQELQKLWIISYGRGRMRILDLDSIRKRACECDDAINSHYLEIFGQKRARDA
jgi:hypothetical protein